MEQEVKQKFEQWCVVELFGHQKIAGLVTEETIGGANFLRVDVPAFGGQSAYTRYFGGGAIYSMTPVAEEIARSALEYLRPRPVETYMLPAPKAETARTLHDDQPGIDFDDDDDPDNEDDDDNPF